MDLRRLPPVLGCGAALALSLCARTAWATTYNVGASQPHKSVCLLLADGAVTLAPGDVIMVDAGTYSDACQVHPSGSSSQPIILRGAAGPRPVFDATGIDLSGSGSVPRAILQFTGASYWSVEHLEFENASNASLNGAAFRVTAGGHDITYRDDSIHDNQDGAQSDGPVSIDIESCEIFHNGAGDGYSHNLYLMGDYVRLQGNYIHDSVGGQNVKLRVHTIELLYNLIANEGNYAIDFEQAPNTDSANANAVMIGNVLVRNPAAINHGQTIVFGADNNADIRNGSLYAINNTFILTNASNSLLNMLNPAPGSKAYFYNNIIHTTVAGPKIAIDSATDALVFGSNNWISTGVTPATAFTASVTGADPGFVSATDFHLTMTSGAIDKALAMPTYVDGMGASQSGVPTSEFNAMPLGTIPRPVVGPLDLGAYEFGMGSPVNDGGTTPDGSTGGVDGQAPGGDAGGPGSSAAGDSGGCGCKVAESGGPNAPRAAAFAGLALLAVVRRRSRRLRLA